MPRLVLIFAAACLAFIVAMMAEKNFRIVETLAPSVEPRTVAIDSLVTVIRDVLTEVEQETSTSSLPLQFHYAELDLSVKTTSGQETGTDLVILDGETAFSETETIALRMRVEPKGADISATAQELAALVIANAYAVYEAAGTDLSLRRVELTYSIAAKASAEGKVKLTAADLELVSGLSRSNETGNQVRIVFLAR
ncbi:hypothetical protein J7363_04130 [Phaeobacter italicus]|uniref:hypothetical protein n=1 Tax=Phaeobacter italicus TaxID=481446 RepID=UPI001ADB062E|nr:hypothetical protein [Phaeobacter italicus]MBO9441270.1 hypothetical protein [Phaeobacter italicus]